MLSTLLYALLSLAAASSAHPLNYEIIYRESQVLVSGILAWEDLSVSNGTDVGRITLAILTDGKTRGALRAFVADEVGVYSIDGIGSHLEIDADKEILKAWGWCFALDGKIPETLAGHTKLSGQEKTLTWYYGFALFRGGQWVSQCERPEPLDPFDALAPRINVW